jgi:transposase
MKAAMTVGGAMNGDLFVAYVEQALVPGLQVGDVVVMDNLSSHKRAEVRRLIEAAGCRALDLPACSPDLNPTEDAFPKLKALLRKAKGRTAEGLQRFLFSALAAFSPDECANYFAHRGYHATPTPIAL